jgi:hypothetical protein
MDLREFVHGAPKDVVLGIQDAQREQGIGGYIALWASAYIDRGRRLLGDGKDDEATAPFAKAILCRPIEYSQHAMPVRRDQSRLPGCHLASLRGTAYVVAGGRNTRLAGALR